MTASFNQKWLLQARLPPLMSGRRLLHSVLIFFPALFLPDVVLFSFTPEHKIEPDHDNNGADQAGKKEVFQSEAPSSCFKGGYSGDEWTYLPKWSSSWRKSEDKMVVMTMQKGENIAENRAPLLEMHQDCTNMVTPEPKIPYNSGLSLSEDSRVS